MTFILKAEFSFDNSRLKETFSGKRSNKPGKEAFGAAGKKTVKVIEKEVAFFSNQPPRKP